MQSRTWTKRFEPGQIKLIAVAAAAIATLFAGAVLSTTLQRDDQAATTSRARVEMVRPATNTRFLGWNTLPGDPGTYPVTSLQEYRFLDWNTLPGDRGTAPVAGLQAHRFLDWNILPDTTGIASALSLQEHRFHDWNILPGDDAKLIPPAHERGVRR